MKKKNKIALNREHESITHFIDGNYVVYLLKFSLIQNNNEMKEGDVRLQNLRYTCSNNLSGRMEINILELCPFNRYFPGFP